MSTSQLSVERELDRGAQISIINLIDALIENANQLRASDIHIDPMQNTVRIRMRIDGVLHDRYTLPRTIHPEVISRIKVMTGLRTDEHQSVQDGRFRHVFPDTEKVIDVRVSMAPTYWGGNVVLRLLSDNVENFTLETMGFSQSDQKKILHALKSQSGMILATGPTGSGKTTTLYALIKMLNSVESSIVTIEDPIEYTVDGIRQIQVNPRAGLTFANGLRSILRQDPDIIMVGEIRDAETASIAVNTALTGHLLLSTLHTNDAATTLPRLLDMKIESYLVASTVNIAIGQRLVRRICNACRTTIPMDKALRENIALLPVPTTLKKSPVFYQGEGCTECAGSGYSGRLSINEVLVADDEIRAAILQRAPSSELKRIAVSKGVTTLLEDGLRKAYLGETTLQEVLRVVHE